MEIFSYSYNEQKLVRLHEIYTKNNTTNMFTKSLNVAKFERCSNLDLLIEMSYTTWGHNWVEIIVVARRRCSILIAIVEWVVFTFELDTFNTSKVDGGFVKAR